MDVLDEARDKLLAGEISNEKYAALIRTYALADHKRRQIREAIEKVCDRNDEALRKLAKN